jgi:membrane associated rhomboid family serine protease
LIPIRDSIPSRRFPLVTVFLIVLNIAIFIYEATLSPAQLRELVFTYGVVPARDGALGAGSWVPLVTAQFLHGGWFHVLGNMLYLWVFGDNVEDLVGRMGFLLLYLTVGVAGNLAHILANSHSAVPTVGASGAVAGILGAYFVSFPRSRILALVPIFFFITFAEIPAIFFLFLWFLMQFLNGVASLAVPGNVVAWWAHVGGFLAGMVLVRLLAARRRRYYY